MTNFINKKQGWYEGYSIGDPSQTNGIEISHKGMKAFDNIKASTPCIKFMKGRGRNMLEEWSKQRSLTFNCLDGSTIINPNVINQI